MAPGPLAESSADAREIALRAICKREPYGDALAKHLIKGDLSAIFGEQIQIEAEQMGDFFITCEADQ